MEPLYAPDPAPKSAQEPWTPREAEFRGAIELDVARLERYGVRRRRPTPGHVAAAIIAGELAGALKSFRGVGRQWSNLADALTVAVQVNRETTARLTGAQNRKRQRIERGRPDAKQIDSHLKRSDLPRITRVAEYQQRDLAPMNPGKGEGGEPSSK